MLGTLPVGMRPGEGLYGSLSNPRYVLPGYWGLTPDFWFNKYSGSFDPYAKTLAWISTVAAVMGILLLVRRRCWSLPLFVMGMTAAYAICLMHLRYAYAASKFGVLAWFAVAYMVVIALEWIYEILDRRSSRWANASIGVGAAFVAGMVGFFFLQQKILYELLPFKSVQEFRKVSPLENLARGLPVVMVVKETYANIWATHFLRDTKLQLAGQYRGYMAESASMARAEPVDFEAVRYVVTDNPATFDQRVLFSREGPYYIWDLGPSAWVLVTEIDNPVGFPVSESSLWITKAYTSLQILSRTTTCAIISAGFRIGGASPEKGREMVHIASSGSFKMDHLLSSGANSFSIPLQPGLNKILLSSAEKDPVTIYAEHLSVSNLSRDETAQMFRSRNVSGTDISHQLDCSGSPVVGWQ